MNKKELITRVLSGVIIGPLVVFSYLSYPTLLGLVTTIVMLSAFELIEMFTKDVDNNLVKLILTFIIGTSSLIYGFALEAEYRGILPFEAELIFFLGFACSVFSILLLTKNTFQAKRFIESSTLGLLYISFFLSNFYLIHINYGVAMSILALTSVWAYDAGAYFVGSKFGKHKLAPVFSPKKSWEGLIGGIFFTFIYILIFSLIATSFDLLSKITWLQTIIISIMVGFFDTLGDLAESIIKRYYNIKDSGEILPGHGGMLDRIDGLLTVTPMWYFLLRILWV